MIGVDNLNDYYDVNLKQDRLVLLKPFDRFTFVKGDISEKVIDQLFEYRPAIVINLAARPGCAIP